MLHISADQFSHRQFEIHDVDTFIPVLPSEITMMTIVRLGAASDEQHGCLLNTKAECSSAISLAGLTVLNNQVCVCWTKNQ